MLLNSKSFFLVNIILFFSLIALSEDRSVEIKKLMWESPAAEFKAIEIPVKWKNESAVILAQQQYNEYVKEVFMNYLYQKEFFHKRIKLNDKAAVIEYSELSYPDNYYSVYESEVYYVGVKIVKPSGTEIVVELKDAVLMEKKTNGYSSKYKKLAIPSLEAGDILDYYICKESTIIPFLKYYTFSTVIFNLQEKYPIIKQSVEFKLKRRCFLNIKLSNNAPELKIKEDAADESTIYYLTSGDIEKTNERLWHYQYRTEPTIKFQVYYAAPSMEGMFDFIGSQRVPKTSITNEELLKYINKYISYKSSNTSYVEAYLKKYHPGEKDPDKIIELSYNYLRGMFYNPLLTAPIYSSGSHFINTMSNIMKKRGIKHELIVSVPREISTIEQAVLSAELEVIMKVNTGKTYYLIPPSVHSKVGDIEYQLQGTEALSINPLVSKSERKLIKITIPVIKHTENNAKNIINIVLNVQDLSSTKAMIEVIESGESKKDDQNMLLSPYPFLEKECNVLKIPGKIEKMKAGEKKDEELRKIERNKEEFNEDLETSLKVKAESEYGIDILSVKNFELVQEGRWSDKPELIYKQEIEFDGLVKKVGTNYLFEVGKLIGKQIELTEEDKKRKYDIYMPYARSYTNEITIEIPTGYSIDGVEALNISEENKTGGFVSKASLQGNKLIISTLKYYINNFEKAEDWKLMEDFLEEAYKFTQKKVLLKKIL